jgi:hypothetical protein
MLNDDGPKYDLELSKKDETRHGLWSLVAQKAKVMLDENGTPRAHVRTLKPKWKEKKVTRPVSLHMLRVHFRVQSHLCFLCSSHGNLQSSESRWSYDRVRNSESPTSRKGAPEGKLDIGGKIKNVLEVSRP